MNDNDKPVMPAPESPVAVSIPDFSSFGEEGFAQSVDVLDEEGNQILVEDFVFIDDKAIGEGGMGVVYKALQVSTGRPVALKVMRTNVKNRDLARKRFEFEVKIASRLEHGNIARVYDSGLPKGLDYYAMEYIRGVPLHEYLELHSKSRADTLLLFAKICDVVQFVHDQKVIHRDLKPGNIMINEAGEPYLVDFGLAVSIEPEDEYADDFTRSLRAGTVEYMAPEQASGTLESLDVRSDVFSLGVILYEALTGRHTVRHEDTNTNNPHVKDASEWARRDLRALKSSIGVELAAILLRALAKDPKRRYLSVAEFAGDIRNFLNGRLVRARRRTPVYVASKYAVRYKWQALVVATVVGVILAVQMITSSRDLNKPDPELYAAKIVQVQAVLDRGDVAEAVRLLNECDERLRDIEWDYLMAKTDVSIRSYDLSDNRLIASSVIQGADEAIGITPMGKVLWYSLTGEGVESQWMAIKGMTPAAAISANMRHAIVKAKVGEEDIWQCLVIDLAERSQKGVLKEYADDEVQSISQLAMAHNGRAAFVVMKSGAVFLDLESGSENRSSPRVPILTVKATERGFMVFMVNGGVALADKSGSWVELGTISDVDMRRQDVAVSADGKRFVLSSEAGARVYGWSSRGEIVPIATIGNLGSRFQTASLGFGGDRLVLGDQSNRIHVFDASSGRKLRSMLGHGSNIRQVALSPDNRRVVSVGSNSLRVWHTDKGTTVPERIRFFNTLTDSGIMSQLYFPTGLGTAWIRGLRKVWSFDMATGKSKLFDEKRWHIPFSVSGDGKYLAYVSKDVVKLHHAEDGRSTGKSIKLPNRPQGGFPRIVLNHDASRIAIEDVTKMIHIWDVNIKKKLWSFPGFGAMCWQPDSNVIVRGPKPVPGRKSDAAMELIRFDCDTGESRKLLAKGGGYLLDMKFSRRGKLLFANGTSGKIFVWKPDDTEPYKSFRIWEKDRRVKFDVNESGSRILTGFTQLDVWDVVTEKKLLTLESPTGDDMIDVVRFIPQKRGIACANEGHLFLWKRYGSSIAH